MDKATKSLTRSIDLHNSQMPEFIKAHGEGSDAVKEKRQKLKNAEAALESITTAQHLETQATIQATKADALNAVGQGRLRDAVNLTKTAIMQEWTATMLSAKSKGILGKALVFLSGGFRIAAFSVKVFGLALLNAIPVIGQIIFVATIAYDLLKGFFSKPPTALDEALEKNKERFDEFPEVIRQMNKAIAAAQTQSEEFLAALRPTTGILNQIAEASASLLVSQENEQIEKIVKAKERKINAEQRVAKAKEAAAKAGLDPEKELSFWEKITKLLTVDPYAPLTQLAEDSATNQILANAELAGAVDEVKEAQLELNAANEELKQIDPLKTYKGVNLALTRGIATFQTAKIAVADNADAVALLDQKIGGLQEILDNLTEDNLAESIEALQTLAREQKAVQESADAAAEAVQSVTALFAKSARPSGVLADHMEALGTALTEMEAGSDFEAIMDKYSEVLKAYGAEGKTDLQETLALFEEVNLNAKTRALDEEAHKQKMVGMKDVLGNVAVLEAEIARQQELKAEYQREQDAYIKAGEIDKALQSQLAAEKAITEEKKKQLEKIKQIAAEDRRRGGDIMGGGASFGAVTSIIQERGGIKDFEQGIKGLNIAAQDTLASLKELGPEGAAYAAIFQGALNATEQWTVSLETIKEKGISLSLIHI